MEPYLRSPMLVVIGAAPAAGALASLGAFTGFDVRLVCGASAEASAALPEVSPGASMHALALDELPALLQGLSARFRRRDLFGVCASMGEYDDVGLEMLLTAQARYIAFLASSRRRDAVLAALRARGRSERELGRVRSPAGVDIGAKTPEEIALSIMAEVVARRRATGPDREPGKDVVAAIYCRARTRE